MWPSWNKGRWNRVQRSPEQELSTSYVVLGITGVISIVLFYFNVSINGTLEEINKYGVQTQATILKNEPVRGKGSLSRVTYSFTVKLPDGKTQVYERMAEIDRASANLLPVGAVTPVKYLPQKPDNFRLLNVSRDDFGLLFVNVCLASNTFIQFMLLAHITMLLRKQKRIYS